MSDKAKEQANEIENEEPITVVEPDEIILENDQEPDSQETTPEQVEIEQLRQQLEEEKKEALFRAAEFENFRRRVLKEKADLIKYGAETAMRNLLPIIDDFERGLAAMKDSNDAEAVREGIELIYKNFIKYLEQNSVKTIESNGGDFDTDYHEAIATIPAPQDDLKGKVLDTVTKGYLCYGVADLCQHLDCCGGIVACNYCKLGRTLIAGLIPRCYGGGSLNHLTGLYINTVFVRTRCSRQIDRVGDIA